MAIATISKFLNALKAISLEEVGKNIERIHKDIEDMITAATESPDGIPDIQKEVNEYLQYHWLVPDLFWVKDNGCWCKDSPSLVNSSWCGLLKYEVEALLKALTGSTSVMVSGGEGPVVMYNTLVAIYRLGDLAKDGALDFFGPFDDIDIADYRLGEVAAPSAVMKEILDLLLWVITQANTSTAWNSDNITDSIAIRFREIQSKHVFQYLKFETRTY